MPDFIRVSNSALDIARRIDPNATFDTLRAWWAFGRPLPRDHFRLVTGRTQVRHDSLYRVSADNRCVLIAGLSDRRRPEVEITPNTHTENLFIITIIALSSTQQQLVSENLEFLLSISPISPDGGPHRLTPTRPTLADPTTLSKVDRDRAKKALKVYRILLSLAGVTSGPDYDWVYQYEHALKEVNYRERVPRPPVSAPQNAGGVPGQSVARVLWNLAHTLKDLHDAGTPLPPEVDSFFKELTDLRPNWREYPRLRGESPSASAEGVDKPAMPK